MVSCPLNHHIQIQKLYNSKCTIRIIYDRNRPYNSFSTIYAFSTLPTQHTLLIAPISTHHESSIGNSAAIQCKMHSMKQMITTTNSLLIIISMYTLMHVSVFNGNGQLFIQESSLQKENKSLLKSIMKKDRKLLRYKQEISEMVYILNMRNWNKRGQNGKYLEITSKRLVID